MADPDPDRPSYPTADFTTLFWQTQHRFRLEHPGLVEVSRRLHEAGVTFVCDPYTGLTAGRWEVSPTREPDLLLVEGEGESYELPWGVAADFLVERSGDADAG